MGVLGRCVECRGGLDQNFFGSETAGTEEHVRTAREPVKRTEKESGLPSREAVGGGFLVQGPNSFDGWRGRRMESCVCYPE